MITLTNNTTSIPLAYPAGWAPADLTAVTLQIADTSAAELQAATAAALYAQTTLLTAAAQFANTLYLAADAEDLAVGDRIRVEGVNGYEEHTVKGYASTGKIATLERVIDRAFEAGATVDRLSAVATVDLSDTDTYPPGIQVVLTWAPAGTGSPLTERAEVEATAQIDVAAIKRDLEALFPRAYDALKDPADRLDTILRMAQDDLRLELASRGMDIARVKDQRLLSPPLLVFVARAWTLNGDDDLIEERKVLNKEYDSAISRLCNLPIWVDADGDGIDDDNETRNFPQFFERNW